MKRAFRALIYAALFSLILSGVFYFVPAEVKYHVTETYPFTGNQAGEQVFLAVMLPKENAYQSRENLHITWPGDTSSENFDAVEVIKLEADSRNAAAVLAYDLTLHQGRIQWEANAAEQDLLPQIHIESDHPVLVQKAEELCPEQTKDTAYRTYQFASAYLSWPKDTRIGKEPSALAAYQTQTGVCGEFANLMTALNRSCGNPARSISGLSMPMYLPPMMTQESTWLHPGGAHAWVEVYHDEHWTLADPSWASKMPFERVWFGRSMGQYLSYGETGSHERIFEELLTWAEENGDLIGAMSAPVKFVASYEGEGDLSITPVVRVKKVSDPRYILAVLTAGTLITASAVIEKQIEKNNIREIG